MQVYMHTLLLQKRITATTAAATATTTATGTT